MEYGASMIMIVSSGMMNMQDINLINMQSVYLLC